MRLLTTTISLALLLLSGAAWAAPGKEGSSKGGSGPSSAGAGPSGAGPSEGGPQGRDATKPDDPTKEKVWEVGASWEYHHLLVQSDLEGAALNKNLDYWSAYARWDITPYDRVQVATGIYQRFIADATETGVRMDDTVVSYARRIPLPAEVTLRTKASLYFPTSFASQKQSLIIAPRLTIQADKAFGHFSLDARLYGDVYVCKYASPEGGGNPNAKFRFAGLVEAGYSMPFHQPLSIGASVFTGWIGFYDVSNGAPTLPGMMKVQTVAQPGQPVQQEYGGEIFVRYNFPAVVGIKSDLTIALADGDPTLGFSSAIHDGVQHLYLGFRQTAEVYGVLAARY